MVIKYNAHVNDETGEAVFEGKAVIDTEALVTYIEVHSVTHGTLYIKLIPIKE